jgi:putative Mg2+ transporter-C (MgtC) family protein
MSFRKGFVPHEADMQQVVKERGYEMAPGSLSIACREGKVEWRFVAVAINKWQACSLTVLSEELCKHPEVEFFQVTHARN